MLRNIIFDVGNVLLRFEPLRWLKTCYASSEADAIYENLFAGPEWPLLDAGAITEDEALARMTARDPARAGALRESFAHWPACLSLIEETAALVPQLRARGYRTYVLSNFSTRFYEIAPHYPVFTQMDGLLISSTEHLVKPDPKIYARLCEKFSLIPSESLFLDDLPQNIQAAQAFGMEGVVYHHGQSVELMQALTQ